MTNTQVRLMKQIMVLLAILLLAVACTEIPPKDDGGDDTSDDVDTPTPAQTTSSLKKFANTEKLMEYLEESQPSQTLRNQGLARGSMAKMASMDMAVAESAAPSAAGADDYSQTNVQVVGVDEADFVKNDGKYIYVLSANKLVIADAYPAESAKIVSETSLEGEPRQLFINDDTMVVFVNRYDEELGFYRYDPIPRPQSVAKMYALVYDVSNREKPQLLHNYSVRGSYYQSRMIDDKVYFIATDSVYYYQHHVETPILKDGAKTVLTPEIYYFDNPEDSYTFHTVVSLDLSDATMNAKTYMLGYSNTMYVSTENMYLTFQKHVPYHYWEDEQKERFFEVIVPLLPGSAKAKIGKDQSWQVISQSLDEMYKAMSEEERRDFADKLAAAIDEYEFKKAQERDSTMIQKIRLSDLSPLGQGQVPGTMHNQFSLDEYKGDLRVATTTQIWAREPTVHNNVFVLDSAMKQIGSLEGLAKGERIYSTRFLGDRLYMVTFQRIDPLFVIDMSVPSKPQVLGELKIPGYSDYLHPYDANHIIGIGKETEANDWGGVSTKGVKIALFDVSDVSKPKEVDKLEIGDQGTDSEVLQDHKAFLFDQKKNLMVIPIREVVRKGKMYAYDDVWYGAYVFDVTEKGFTKKGSIKHDESKADSWYWGSPSAVRRSLYMDNVLYTISSKRIKMNELSAPSKELGEIKLPYEEERYPYPMYSGPGRWIE